MASATTPHDGANQSAQQPPAYPLNSTALEWETRVEKSPRGSNSELTSFRQRLSTKIDHVFPPYRTYFHLKRRTFFIVLLVLLLCIIALAIGLAVGLSLLSSEFVSVPYFSLLLELAKDQTTNKSGGSDAQNLPLPTDTKQHTGDLTYYEPGLGACGITSTSDEDVVAISHYTWDALQVGTNPNANPLCGLMLRATRYNEVAGEQRSVDLKVVDRCTGCEPTDIDTTTTVFEELALIESGRVLVTWAWLDSIPGLDA